MRIAPDVLTELTPDAPLPAERPRTARIRRIRETLERGLYTVDLDQLARRLADRD